MPAGKKTTSHWRLQSRQVIADVVAKHPEAKGEELKKLLSAAYPFGERQYTPYKLWLEEVNYVVEGHAAMPKLGHESAVMPAYREWARARGLID